MGNWFKRFELTVSVFLVILVLIFFVRAIGDSQTEFDNDEIILPQEQNELDVGEDVILVEDEKVIAEENQIKVILIDDKDYSADLDYEKPDMPETSNYQDNSVKYNELDISNLEDENIIEQGQVFLFLNDEENDIVLEYGMSVNVTANTPTGNLMLYRNGYELNLSELNNLAVLGAGYYNYTALSIGYSNYTNVSISYFVNVTKKDPTQGMSILGLNSITYGSNSSFYGNESNLGDEDCNYTLSIPNGIYDAGPLSIYYFTAGCSNYSAGNITDELYIYKAIPNLFLSISPSSLLAYSNITNVTGFGCPNQLNCTLYRNGLPKTNPEIVTLGAGTYNYNFSTSGNSNYIPYSVYSNLVVLQNVSSVYLDTQKPIVTLDKPSDGSILVDDRISFVFSAQDNIKVSNCTYSLYFYNNSVSIGSLVYSEIRNNIVINQTNTIILEDFDEGEYSCDVGCYDNSSNYHEKGRDFYYEKNVSVSIDNKRNNQSLQTISLQSTSYEYEDEISDLISKINEFLVKEEKYGPDELSAIESMGITENLRFYKKKLLQIKSDMDHNLDFVSDSTKRQSMQDQIESDLGEIKNNIPLDLKIIDKKSYSKNTLENDITDSIKSYLTKKNIFMDERALNNLVESIRSKQSNLVVESEAKEIEITYTNNKKQEFILIDKKVNLKNSAEFESLIEIIPKSVSESATNIVFINENVVINEDPIFEIDTDNLEDGKLIYYIKNGNFKDVEKIDSIVFGESILISGSNSRGITGFAIVYQAVNGGIGFYLSWIIVLAIAILLIYLYLRTKKISKLKKNQDFRFALDQIKLAKKYIDNNEISLAKQHYYSLKSTYSKLDDSMKKMIYTSIVKIQSSIDKKEISNLLRECLLAIKEKRTDDARLMYSQIKPIYGRLPKQYREKVYSKIIPFVR